MFTSNFCGTCGTSFAPQETFCGQCGAPRDLATSLATLGIVPNQLSSGNTTTAVAGNPPTVCINCGYQRSPLQLQCPNCNSQAPTIPTWNTPYVSVIPSNMVTPPLIIQTPTDQGVYQALVSETCPYAPWGGNKPTTSFMLRSPSGDYSRPGNTLSYHSEDIITMSPESGWSLTTDIKNVAFQAQVAITDPTTNERHGLSGGYVRWALSIVFRANHALTIGYRAIIGYQKTIPQSAQQNSKPRGFTFGRKQPSNQTDSSTSLPANQQPTGFYIFRPDMSDRSIVPCPALRYGKPNLVAVVAQENVLDFYINLQHITRVYDTRYMNVGDVGIHISNCYAEVSLAKLWKK
jgi:hypothetical protein